MDGSMLCTTARPGKPGTQETGANPKFNLDEKTRRYRVQQQMQLFARLLAQF
jgi:hypothetical protein